MNNRNRWVGWIATFLGAWGAGAQAGHLDTSFGVAGRIYLGNRATYKKLSILPDGSVQIVSSEDGQLAIRRFDPMGKPDASFGAAGYREIDLPVSATSASVLATSHAGETYLSLNIAGSDQLARLDASGALDQTFGQHGVRDFVEVPEAPGASAYVRRLAIADDGVLYVLVAFRSSYYDCDKAGRIYRLSPDGEPDLQFGDGGYLAAPLICWFDGDLDALAALDGDRLLYLNSVGQAKWLDSRGQLLEIPPDWARWFRDAGLVQIAYSAHRLYTVDVGPLDSRQVNVRQWNVDLTPDTGFGPRGDGSLSLPLSGMPFSSSSITGFMFLPPEGPGSYAYVGIMDVVDRARDDQSHGSAYESVLVRIAPDGRLDSRFGTDGNLRSFSEPEGELLRDVRGGVLLNSPRYGIFRLTAEPIESPGLLVPSLSCTDANWIDETSAYKSVIVERIFGSDGPARLTYRTLERTARPGVNYDDTSGTLEWDSNEDGRYEFAIPIRVYGSRAAAYLDFEIFLGTGGALPATVCDRAIVRINQNTSTPPADTSAPPARSSGEGSGGGGSLEGGFLALLGILMACRELRRYARQR